MLCFMYIYLNIKIEDIASDYLAKISPAEYYYFASKQFFRFSISITITAKQKVMEVCCTTNWYYFVDKPF